jgi:hypothetical protein
MSTPTCPLLGPLVSQIELPPVEGTTTATPSPEPLRFSRCFDEAPPSMVAAGSEAPDWVGELRNQRDGPLRVLPLT